MLGASVQSSPNKAQLAICSIAPILSMHAHNTQKWPESDTLDCITGAKRISKNII